MHEMAEEKRKELVDRYRLASPNYKEGDLVLVTTHLLSNASKGISAKFAPRRDGPYLIKKKRGPSSYEIADPTNPDVALGTHHSSALRPFSVSGESLPVPTQPLRKRGRPRKLIQVEVPPRRGRGRPRKNAPSLGQLRI